METKAERRFNLVEENWIPVAGEGLVSLKRVFSDNGLKALGGNPVEKIALLKLLLAIAQAAHTPEDDEAWANLGFKGMAEKAVAYLENNKDCFWLYGDKPFLQIPAIKKAKLQNFCAVLPDIATGNTTVLMNSQIEKNMSDAEKALMLVFLSGFSLGGKKTDNSVVLSQGYMGKTNEKGKLSAAKSGTSIGYLGYLHSFISGHSIIETIWLNLVTMEQTKLMPQFEKGVGIPPWEKMPEGENCKIAQELKRSLMGRLVSLCRFVLINENGIHYSEGIAHPSHKDGGYDLSMAVDFSKQPKVLWANPEKRPWREITALLSFFDTQGNNRFDCPQLRLNLPRIKQALPEFNIWSGGLRVSSNAGEQYVAGNDDYLESEINLKSDHLGKIWFSTLKTEMDLLENMAKTLYGATMGYYKQQKADGKNQAAKATNLFWQLSERKFQTLLDACGDETGKKIGSVRHMFIDYAYKAYNTFCQKDTARQMDAWAANQPGLWKFIRTRGDE